MASDDPAESRRATLRLIRLSCSGAAAVIAAVQIARIFHRPATARLSDLDVYVGAGRTLLAGGDLYDFTTRAGAPFTYPPTAGLLFTPLARAETITLQVAWTAATVAAVLAIATMSGRTEDPKILPCRLITPALALLLIASGPISSNIRLGQVSAFLAAMVVADSCGIVPRRFRGILTGLGAAIKLTR